MKAKLNAARRLALAVPVAMLTAGIFSTTCAAAEPRSETVKFADLNVNTTAGIRVLYGRIRQAAKHVCDESDPVMRTAAPVCVRQAVGRAVEKLELPLLTAFHKEQIGVHQELLSANR